MTEQELVIADKEKQIAYWQKVHEMTERRLKEKTAVLDDVIVSAKEYEAIVREREAAMDAMRKQVAYTSYPNGTRLAEIQLGFMHVPAEVSIAKATKDGNTEKAEITFFMPSLMRVTPEHAAEGAIALAVLAQIGREWEAEAAKEEAGNV